MLARQGQLVRLGNLGTGSSQPNNSPKSITGLGTAPMKRQSSCGGQKEEGSWRARPPVPHRGAAAAGGGGSTPAPESCSSACAPITLKTGL